MARGGEVGLVSNQGPGRRYSLGCIRTGKLPEGLFRPSGHSHHQAYSMGRAEYSHTPRYIQRGFQDLEGKIRVGVYERSNSAYRSKWFCVLKKDGKSLWLIHDLQPLNAVTIKDSGVLPILDSFADSLGGRGCYTGLDLFIAFDHMSLSVQSHELTTFQTPL